MPILTRDYETRSLADIKKVGGAAYARHPSTQVFCMAIAVDAAEPKLWVSKKFKAMLPPQHDLPIITDEELTQIYSWPGATTESHNDAFEYAVDTSGKVPCWPQDMPRKCSLAQAAHNALPPALGTLTKALGLPQDEVKDSEGGKLLLKMCKPLNPRKADWAVFEGHTMCESPVVQKVYEYARKCYTEASSKKASAYYGCIARHWQVLVNENFDPNLLCRWEQEPENLVRLFQYCLQDVIAERAASNAMPKMNKSEQACWELDQRINRRGVLVDVASATKAIDCVARYKDRKELELAEITGGAVVSVGQTAKLKDWCKAHGVDMPNMAKDTVDHYLQQDTHPDVKKVLEIKKSCGQTSVTKFSAMIRAACEDNRVRGVFAYSAAGTGRWAARMLQLHNMPRGTVKLKTDTDIEQLVESIGYGWRDLELMYGDVMGPLSSAIRGCIMAAEGKKFLASDFSSVEARGLPYLAHDEESLNVFRTGLDVYKVAASGIFGKPYDEIDRGHERPIGKVSVLALGFGGGIGAWASMARNYGLDLETLIPLILPTASGFEYKKAESIAKTYLENLEKRIKLKLEKGVGSASPLERMSLEAAISCDIIKQRWRITHPRIVEFWADLEHAAMLALRNPGEKFAVGRVAFTFKRNFLLCKLPSGRCLRYYKPSIVKRKKFGKYQDTIGFWRMVDGRWTLTETYGGKLAENVTQAHCRDLLVAAMHRVEAAGYTIVLHVHDEVVSEVDEDFGSLEEYDNIMAQTPAWSVGMPMKAEGWCGKRYRK